jgi:hypothetical protein
MLSITLYGSQTRHCFPRYVPKGTPVIEEGAWGDYFYIVESGACAVAKAAKPGAIAWTGPTYIDTNIKIDRFYRLYYV